VSLIRFCMLNGSRIAVKPSSRMRRTTFTMSAQAEIRVHRQASRLRFLVTRKA
jgi:hypothetical protein